MSSKPFKALHLFKPSAETEKARESAPTPPSGGSGPMPGSSETSNAGSLAAIAATATGHAAASGRSVSAPTSSPFDSVRLLDPFGDGKSSKRGAKKSPPRDAGTKSAAQVNFVETVAAPVNAPQHAPDSAQAALAEPTADAQATLVIEPVSATPLVHPAVAINEAQHAFAAAEGHSSRRTSPFASIRLQDPFEKTEEPKETSDDSTKAQANSDPLQIFRKQMPEMA